MTSTSLSLLRPPAGLAQHRITPTGPSSLAQLKQLLPAGHDHPLVRAEVLVAACGIGCDGGGLAAQAAPGVELAHE